MSIGNTKDQGNKGNNFPYQLRTLQLLSSINDGIAALPGVDYETRTSTYQATCTICGPGYSTGDIIIRYDIIDVATQTLAAVMWFNQTTQGIISPAPASGDLTPISAPSGVTVLNGPLGAAVNIQDGGNSITVDANDLDIRDLDFATDSVDVSGSSVSISNFPVTQDVNIVSSITLNVQATSLDIRPLDCATDEVAICSDGNPVGPLNPMPINNINLDTPLSDIYNNVVSKMARISGAGDYNRAIAYINAPGGDFRVSTVTHTGNTGLSVPQPETIIETFTYYPATDNVTNIQYF